MQRLIILIICFLFSVQATGQTRAELEKRRQNIIDAIRQTEEQLAATRKDKNATMGQLRALQNKLAERRKLIGNINQEIAAINNNIQQSNNEVSNLKNNLEVLKMRYAQSVRYAYKTRSSYDMLAFLFSSDNFNEALRRIRYLRKYRENRKMQAQQIRVTQGAIENKIHDLSLQKSEKDVLLTAEEQQRLVLQKESDQTNKVVTALKGKEKELAREIEKNRKAAKQLDKAVANIIRQEMELARKKAEEEARKRADEERRQREEEARRTAAASKTGVNVNTGSGIKGGDNKGASTTTTSASKVIASSEPVTPPAAARPVAKPAVNLSLTPEAAALSNNFEANRGRLPWPVEKGFISMGFGTHKHPVAEKVMVENNGVDITTSAGATARAVFEGTVSKVFYIDGMDWNVLVNHGHYFTLYSRLGNVSVKKDQIVKTKQVIGSIAANEEGSTVINFQIWKDGNKLNPETWIAR
jgi:septal ring factor EnvC (AmiA/AmiB activator)